MAKRTCTIKGCNKPTQARGWCSKHYFRWRRHGDTTTTHRGSGSISSAGYLRVKRPGHPLLQADGYIYMHRVVLYDAIGSGPHACHWCGRTVDWQPNASASLLEVDHLDADKMNNDRTNLVPSCGGCNRHRARWPESFAHRCNVNAGPAGHDT